MKRAIVIGGSGFLGRHLLNHLQNEGIEILAVTNKTPLNEAKNVKLLEGGIAAINLQLINNFNPDVIFHCARPTLPRFRKLGRQLAAKKAFKLNKKLIENIGKAERKPKLVFASGSLMYGNSSMPHDEQSPLNPISYAKQYFKGEIPVNEAVAKSNFPVVVLRFPWLLGNGSWFKWFFLENIKKFNTILTFGDLKNNMEIVDVEDAARLMKLYAEEITESGIYNVTSRNPVAQAEFANDVANEFGCKLSDYTKLFPKGLEKEALEALTSNIALTTLHPEILDNYHFISTRESLRRIKKHSETV